VPALTVPAGDTRLHVLDAEGGAPPVVLINGAFGTLQNWNRVTAGLGDRYRVIRFDARGRGKSGTSADYSVTTAAEDIGRVMTATGVTRPVLVGWSHGATTAVRYAARNPGHIAGLVLVDGAFPTAMFGDDAARQRVRAQFRGLGLLMRVSAAVGRGARMSPEQAADLVIEMDAVNGELAGDFKALDCPATFVVGTGGHSGAPAEEVRTMRAAVAVALAANERVSVFATAACNHTQILSKGAGLVVAAIHDVAVKVL
jgi:pimeloyl-ACP methyl ester carboxylesterase